VLPIKSCSGCTGKSHPLLFLQHKSTCVHCSKQPPSALNLIHFSDQRDQQIYFMGTKAYEGESNARRKIQSWHWFSIQISLQWRTDSTALRRSVGIRRKRAYLELSPPVTSAPSIELRRDYKPELTRRSVKSRFMYSASHVALQEAEAEHLAITNLHGELFVHAETALHHSCKIRTPKLSVNLARDFYPSEFQMYSQSESTGLPHSLLTTPELPLR
jgi:hypothetical protein